MASLWCCRVNCSISSLFRTRDCKKYSRAHNFYPYQMLHNTLKIGCPTRWTWAVASAHLMFGSTLCLFAFVAYAKAAKVSQTNQPTSFEKDSCLSVLTPVMIRTSKQTSQGQLGGLDCPVSRSKGVLREHKRCCRCVSKYGGFLCRLVLLHITTPSNPSPLIVHSLTLRK